MVAVVSTTNAQQRIKTNGNTVKLILYSISRFGEIHTYMVCHSDFGRNLEFSSNQDFDQSRNDSCMLYNREML
jgi:hypothetical protein